jgi:hypothetical protein
MIEKVCCESVQTQCETGTRRREAMRLRVQYVDGLNAEYCSAQVHIRACSRSFMNYAG